VRQKVNNALGRRTLVAIASADGNNLPVGFHGCAKGKSSPCSASMRSANGRSEFKS
jgi:hypothetical protein